MNKTPHYASYLKILEEELIPAMGCTEPIAVALAAAKAREALDLTPERCRVEVSGNIIKNVKAVTVPNTGGMKGLEGAAAAGIAAGRADLELEVLSQVTDEGRAAIRRCLETCAFEVVPAGGDRVFYIKITVEAQGHSACCEIVDFHTNIVLIQKDGQALFQSASASDSADVQTDRSILSVEEIVRFADCLDPADVREVLGRQIAYNTAIAAEGLKGGWGAQVGKTLRAAGGDSAALRAKSAAAAGSDARMGGCEMPVIINSGSGNQGITASVPVARYAHHLGATKEQLYRALLVSDLVTVHQKSGIGRLSAYCGAVSAGVGAGAGIAYLLDGSYEAIAHTIVNAVAIISGTICDGAKPSCAAKIAASVDAGILGYSMYKNHQEFKSGDGIVTKGVDNTIANIGILAQQGMRQTGQTILSIMTERCK